MTIYRSSDWHLGHERIIELCDRPFKNVDHMNHAIIDNANAVAGENDTLVLHGDNVMGEYLRNLELLRKLTVGRLVLMPGNHDRFSIAMTRRPTKNPEPERLAREAQKREDAIALIEDVLGDAFTELIIVRDQEPSVWYTAVGGYKCAVSHYPYVGDSHGADRYAYLRPSDEGFPIIHGHVHGEWRENGRQLNVGVDVWDFKPVSDHAIGVWLDGLATSSGGSRES